MASRREFGGKVVVITGAAGGIGAALARRFARAGSHLALLDIDRPGVEALAAELTSSATRCVAIGCDISDEQDCRRAIAAVLDVHGGIDVLVNNAGITQRSLFADTEAAVFARVMAVNFFGALHCTKAALASLVARRGLLIVTSSIAGQAPLYERSGYAASKHALHGLFGSLRAELRSTGVDVMLICPGFTATGIGRAALDGAGRPAAHRQSTVGRMATAESVAEAIFDGATKSRRLLVLTTVGKISVVLNRIAPALYEKMMTRSIRREIEAARRP